MILLQHRSRADSWTRNRVIILNTVFPPTNVIGKENSKKPEQWSPASGMWTVVYFRNLQKVTEKNNPQKAEIAYLDLHQHQTVIYWLKNRRDCKSLKQQIRILTQTVGRLCLPGLVKRIVFSAGSSLQVWCTESQDHIGLIDSILWLISNSAIRAEH